MRLRTQLLLINLASLALLMGAVVYSYSKMLLNLDQARLFSFIVVGAGILSSVAYWFMTIPITNSVKRLIRFAEQVGDGRFEEVRQLTESVQEMKEKIHDSLQKLESMEKTRRELIANVSHDLRTPIASIQSFVEALDDGIIDDDETSHLYLTTIHREVRRLSSLIDDLFELSKLDGPATSLHHHLLRVINDDRCCSVFAIRSRRADIVPTRYLLRSHRARPHLRCDLADTTVDTMAGRESDSPFRLVFSSGVWDRHRGDGIFHLASNPISDDVARPCIPLAWLDVVRTLGVVACSCSI
jgi:signal transduction histidine kinase